MIRKDDRAHRHEDQAVKGGHGQELGGQPGKHGDDAGEATGGQRNPEPRPLGVEPLEGKAGAVDDRIGGCPAGDQDQPGYAHSSRLHRFSSSAHFFEPQAEMPGTGAADF